MTTERELIEMVESVMRACGEEVSDIADLVGQPARVFTYPNCGKVFGMFAIDLIFREDGAVVLQESNGSNGASTGMLPDGQARRAEHMARTALARKLAKPCVALLAHADKTALKAEFYVRQMLFVDALRAAGAGTVTMSLRKDIWADTLSQSLARSGMKRWTPSFGQENAEIKLVSQVLRH